VFFNLGAGEIGVLLVIALVVFGPDKLPQLAKDAGKMLRTLRDMAQGARHQLTDELGPEFSNIDIRSFNPRTALKKAIFDDDDEPATAAPATTTAAEPEPAKPEVRPLARDEKAPYDEDTT
jgi:sec-independent protein translocase protein TatB